MIILVTGGCGFIGTVLCTELLARGHSVVNLDKLTYAANKAEAEVLSYHERYTLVEGDCCRYRLVADLLRLNKCDAVMHLAAESHVDRSISGPQTFLEANVLGTYGVLEGVRAYLPDAPSGFKLVHVSTDEVFGEVSLPDTFFDESSPYKPSSPYSASKAAADHLVRAWGRTFNVPYCLTHGANAYGPAQLPDKLIPMAITRGLQGKVITIHGTGRNVRSWLHVQDHVTGLLAVLERGRLGESYCLEDGVELTNLETVKLISAELSDLGISTTVEHVADRPGNDLAYRMDSGKARTELGWQPTQDFDVALKQTVQWYLRQSKEPA